MKYKFAQLSNFASKVSAVHKNEFENDVRFRFLFLSHISAGDKPQNWQSVKWGIAACSAQCYFESNLAIGIPFRFVFKIQIANIQLDPFATTEGLSTVSWNNTKMQDLIKTKT